MPRVRRNYPRIPIVKNVTLTVNGRELAYAECNNISMGGMCVSVRDSVEMDQCGTVDFIYESENDSINFKGEFSVCWVRAVDEETQEFGLKFVYYDSVDLTNLARIVLNQLQCDQVTD